MYLKNFFEFSEEKRLSEAMDISLARKATELFLNSDGKKRYNELFNGQDRIYYDFKSENVISSPVLDEIKNLLNSNGYSILDYLEGICYKNSSPKNTIKIQKVLNKILGNDTLSQKMNADPVRSSSKKADKKIVISRHGLDIAAQSTGRDWTSCQVLGVDTGIPEEESIWTQIKNGGLISYLIEGDDLNINKPIARLLIGVYRNKDKVIFFPAHRIYGNYHNEDFKSFIYDWCVDASIKMGSVKGEYKVYCNYEGAEKVKLDGGSLHSYIKNVIIGSDDISLKVLHNKNKNELKEYVKIFKELTKIDKKEIEYKIKNLNLDSDFIVKLLNMADLKDIENMIRKHPSSLSEFLNKCQKDWSSITEKRRSEIYNLYEEILSKNIIDKLMESNENYKPVYRFLKIEYANKYK